MAKREIDTILEEDLTITIGDRSGIKIKWIRFCYSFDDERELTGVYISPMDTNGEGFRDQYDWQIMGSFKDSYLPKITVQYKGQDVSGIQPVVLHCDGDIPHHRRHDHVVKINVASKSTTTLNREGEMQCHNYSKRGSVKLHVYIDGK